MDAAATPAAAAAGRTALVTGSARRVGRAIAAGLIASGWHVLIHAREGERARATSTELGAAGAIGADLAQVTEVEQLAAAAAATPAVQQRGGLDLLVNAAASFEHVARWEDADAAGWARAMDVNARAPYLLTAALLDELRAMRGLVLNVSDIAAHEHWPTFPIHAASKAALESLTLSGAAALADDGVRMVAIAPGTILAPDRWSAERVERERAAGLLGTPDALVRMILELADDPTRSGEIIPL